MTPHSPRFGGLECRGFGVHVFRLIVGAYLEDLRLGIFVDD